MATTGGFNSSLTQSRITNPTTISAPPKAKSMWMLRGSRRISRSWRRGADEPEALATDNEPEALATDNEPEALATDNEPEALATDGAAASTIGMRWRSRARPRAARRSLHSAKQALATDSG